MIRGEAMNLIESVIFGLVVMAAVYSVGFFFGLGLMFAQYVVKNFFLRNKEPD